MAETSVFKPFETVNSFVREPIPWEKKETTSHSLSQSQDAHCSYKALHSRTESAGQLSIPTYPLISLYQVLANLDADDTSHEHLETLSDKLSHDFTRLPISPFHSHSVPSLMQPITRFTELLSVSSNPVVSRFQILDTVRFGMRRDTLGHFQYL